MSKVWRVKKPEILAVEVPLDILGIISVFLDKKRFDILQNYIIGTSKTLESYEKNKIIFEKIQNQREFVNNFQTDCFDYDENLLPTSLHNISLEEAPELIVLAISSPIPYEEILVIHDLIANGMELTKNLAKVLLQNIESQEEITKILYNKIFQLDWNEQELYDIYKNLKLNRINNLNSALISYNDAVTLCKLTDLMIKYEREFLSKNPTTIQKIRFYVNLCDILLIKCPEDHEKIKSSVIVTVTKIIQNVSDYELYYSLSKTELIDKLKVSFNKLLRM